MNSVLIFGKVPPPVGGVTKSVENTLNAFKYRHIRTTLFSPAMLFSFRKYDVAHIHYLKRWKIITALFLGKVFAKKNILTYHGSDFYPDTQWLDSYVYKLLDGVVVLNELVLKRCQQLDASKVVLLTPIFQEGLANQDSQTVSYFEKEKDTKYILLYASRKDFFNSMEVYGCHFIFSLLDNLSEHYTLVFLDPQKSYEDDMKKINMKKIIYIDKPVDFTNLLLSVDIYIRPTSRDGSSIAILEALSVNVPVLASDIVDRGAGVETYKHNDSKDFINKINTILTASQTSNIRQLSSIHTFEKFCDQLLKKDAICVA